MAKDILFHSKDLLHQLFVYGDRIELKGVVKSKLIPLQKVANVSYNKLSGKLTIETSGGEKSEYQFIGFGGWKKSEEASRIISGLIS